MAVKSWRDRSSASETQSRAGGATYTGQEHQNTQNQSNPGAPNTKDGAEGELIKGVAVILPGRAEADMGQADGAPGEESGQTGQSLEPVEHLRTVVVDVDIAEASKQQQDDHGEQRATRAIDIGEDLGSVALLGQGSEGTGTTIHGGHTDRQDRDENDDVHERVETLQAGVFTNQDEGRGVDIGIRVGTEESIIVGVDKQTDEEETQDVEARQLRVSTSTRMREQTTI